MKTEENNMGNMSKSEVIDFFNCVTDDLGIVLALEFTPVSPSIYLEKGEKIFFCERDLVGYKWLVKERVLHEISHHFEQGKRTHGPNFYKVYAELVSKYLAGMKVSDKQSLSGYFASNGQLQRMVRGCIQDFINAHNEVNRQNADGLAKRITSQIRGFILKKPSNHQQGGGRWINTSKMLSAH